MIIVPTRTSILDAEALHETLQALSDADKLDRTVVVINAPNGDKAVLADILRLCADDYEVPVISPGLADDAALAVSLGKGRSVVDAPRRGAAGKAVLALMGELLRHSKRIERARKRENA